MAADRNGFQCNQVFLERQSSPDDLSPGAGTAGGAGRLAVTVVANPRSARPKKFF